MAVVSLNTNTPAQSAQRRLSESTKSLSDSFLRLSSGLRINRASDDAAGLAIASDLNTDARVFAQGIRNFNDGLSLLNIAEGALREASNIIIRIRELSTQSANGTLTSAQRVALDEEANTLVDEFNRIVETTEFNDLKLIDKSLANVSLQGGYGVNGQISLALGDQLSREVGTGSFTLGSIFPLTAYDGFGIGDVNGDGKVDLLTSDTAGNFVTFRLGAGDGTFTESGTVAVTAPTASVVADFNGDGLLDIAAKSGASNISILLGRADGSFQSEVIQTLPSSIDILDPKDYNGDGLHDLFIIPQPSGTPYIMLSNGDGSFRGPLTLSNSAYDSPSDERTEADFNNDGFVDIVFRDNTTNTAYVLLNNGDGSFQNLGAIAPAVGFLGTTFNTSGDINNDGNVDVVFHTGFDSFAILGNGDGTFRAPQTIASGDVLPSLGDFNNDGNLDLLSGSLTGTAALRYGNGDGTFGDVVTTINVGAGVAVSGPFQLTSDGPSGILALDFDTFDFHLYAPVINEVTTLPHVNLRSRPAALQTMDLMDAALTRVNSELGAIGAFQGRLTVALNNLSQGKENYQSSASQILDADIAVESAQLLRSRILQQAGAAILSQANKSPELALLLLGS